MINRELPMIMHIDLNSCFATIEQQANRLLRGRPVAVSAYGTPRGMVLAASYEAKRLGIKLGVNNAEARQLAPDVVILTPDPSKYREAHRLFRSLLMDYTDNVKPKSIDEFVLDLTGSPALRSRSHMTHNEAMIDISYEIKKRIKEDLGEWVTVNIGIGTNRFLAKYAAGFNKPDGLTLIDHANLTDYYRDMQLVDLPGINVRYAARLHACGITNPIEFYEADVDVLKKRVFKSVVGYYWWARLRGHEVDNREFTRKSIGHQYALSKKTNDKHELRRLLMKLCEKVGRRLRKADFCARGIHLYLGFENYRTDSHKPKNALHSDMEIVSGPVGFEQMSYLKSWHEGHRLEHRMYATSDIFHAACYLLTKAELPNRVRIMAVTVYDLEPWDPEQLSIFDSIGSTPAPIGDKKAIVQTEYRPQEANRRLSDAMDAINNRYGEFVLVSGLMMDMKGEILDRIAFGNAPDIASD